MESIETPGIRYELRDMRYEIMRIFTLPRNDPHCRSEERSDVLGAVAACGLRILSAELGTPRN